jgi:RNA polymerase sigma-70 factor (ECF subfamily)
MGVLVDEVRPFVACDVGELVRHCLAGDEAAVRQFVERFQQVVFGLCVRMLGNRHDAEDATQETLLRAVRNLHRWDATRPLLPWLLAIAGNRCRTALEQRARRPRMTELTPDTFAQPDNSVRELGEELRFAIEQLREDYRTTFQLFYHQQLNCTQISEALGVPEGTVKTWLHRARRELVERLERRGITPEGHYELHRI